MRVLLTLLLMLCVTQVQAAGDRSDHPLVSAYQGSTLRNKDVKEYDAYRTFSGTDAKTDELVGTELEGKVTRIVYKNPAKRSVLEIYRNYEIALKKAGADILHQCDQAKYECVKRYAQGALNKHSKISVISNTAGRYILGKVKQDDQVAYVAIAVGPSYTQIDVVEIKAMDTGMSMVNAAAFGDGLDKDGYVIVEGIYFDTDKAVLKSESKPALDEVAKLLTARESLNLYVVGHTDMQGGLGHNMKLSEDRAVAVVKALTDDYRIGGNRLEGHGVGPLAPQSANSGDSGRAKNRRVVLVVR